MVKGCIERYKSITKLSGEKIQWSLRARVSQGGISSIARNNFPTHHKTKWIFLTLTQVKDVITAEAKTSNRKKVLVGARWRGFWGFNEKIRDALTQSRGARWHSCVLATPQCLAFLRQVLSKLTNSHSHPVRVSYCASQSFERYVVCNFTYITTCLNFHLLFTQLSSLMYSNGINNSKIQNIN